MFHLYATDSFWHNAFVRMVYISLGDSYILGFIVAFLVYIRPAIFFRLSGVQAEAGCDTVTVQCSRAVTIIESMSVPTHKINS